MSKLSLPIPKRVLAPTDWILPMTTWERENRLVETPRWTLRQPTLSTRSFATTLPTLSPTLTTRPTTQMTSPTFAMTIPTNRPTTHVTSPTIQMTSRTETPTIQVTSSNKRIVSLTWELRNHVKKCRKALFRHQERNFFLCLRHENKQVKAASSRMCLTSVLRMCLTNSFRSGVATLRRGSCTFVH